MRNNKQTATSKSERRKTKIKPGLSKSVVTYRKVETRLRETRPERFVPYAGQWIALEGEQIIANGQDLREVIQQARAHGVCAPYVFYVQSNTELAKLTL